LKRLLVAIVFVLSLWPSNSRADGVLLVVTEVQPNGEQAFWWATPKQPRWTASDQALRSLLKGLGHPVIDPAAMTSPPSFSQRVFGRPHLSTTNALNFASLFGASRLITGDVVLSHVKAPLSKTPGVQVRVNLHLFATHTTVELLPLQIEATAYADSLAQAEADARKQVMGRVRALLAHTGGLIEANVGIETQEPVFVLTGLDHARPLVDIKRALKKDAAVTDAVEVWAAEGVIAIEINPGQVDSPTQVTQALDRLLKERFDDFEVHEVRRDGQRIELRIQRRIVTPE